MGKHLIDIDETALRDARAELGAQTIKETVNRALRLASGERERAVKKSLDRLAGRDFEARERAWR
jgi:Arc/MetJ family transcription regulator